MLSRVDIIQRIIDFNRARRYLEIGAGSGTTFLRVRARRKVAVDPFAIVALRSKIKWAILRPCNTAARYVRATSDEFFLGLRHGVHFDVAFLDGLHTYRQVLKDFSNTLAVLNERGVIVVHDCNPPDETAAYPAESAVEAESLKLPDWKGEWCGEVWKAIVWLRSRRPDLMVFVLDCDYGLGIITRAEPEEMLDLAGTDPEALSYDDLAQNRERFLNLKKPDYLDTVPS